MIGVTIRHIRGRKFHSRKNNLSCATDRGRHSWTFDSNILDRGFLIIKKDVTRRKSVDSDRCRNDQFPFHTRTRLNKDSRVRSCQKIPLEFLEQGKPKGFLNGVIEPSDRRRRRNDRDGRIPRAQRN